MGRKPEDSNVIRLRGNDRLADAREAATPRPHPVAPKPPKELSHWAKVCWTEHAPELERLGLLTVLDGAAFRFLCEDFAIAVSALLAMRPSKKDGTPDRRSHQLQVVVADTVHGGVKRNPAFLIYKQAVGDYRDWCAKFGLTPRDRINLRPGAPIGAEPDEDDGDDASFFGT